MHRSRVSGGRRINHGVIVGEIRQAEAHNRYAEESKMWRDYNREKLNEVTRFESRRKDVDDGGSIVVTANTRTRKRELSDSTDRPSGHLKQVRRDREPSTDKGVLRRHRGDCAHNREDDNNSMTGLGSTRTEKLPSETGPRTMNSDPKRGGEIDLGSKYQEGDRRSESPHGFPRRMGEDGHSHSTSRQGCDDFARYSRGKHTRSVDETPSGIKKKLGRDSRDEVECYNEKTVPCKSPPAPRNHQEARRAAAERKMQDIARKSHGAGERWIPTGFVEANEDDERVLWIRGLRKGEPVQKGQKDPQILEGFPKIENGDLSRVDSKDGRARRAKMSMSDDHEDSASERGSTRKVRKKKRRKEKQKKKGKRRKAH